MLRVSLTKRHFDCAKCGLIILVVLSMCMVSSGLADSLLLAAPPDKVAVLIGFHGPPDANIVQAVGGDVDREFTLVNVIAARLPSQAIDALRKQKSVRYVELDRPVQALGSFGQRVPWGIARVFQDEVYPYDAWDITRGEGIAVAVLDTGIATSHPDLNVVGGRRFYWLETAPPGQRLQEDDGYDDVHGHGTHVAGTIAALDNTIGVVGVAPSIELYAVKVLTDTGNGHTSAVVAGIEWAVNQGIPILNMSFGSSTSSQTEEDACNAAYDAGHLLVAAAGNSGSFSGTGDNVGYPARYDSVIAVAASTSSDTRASFSSTGPAVELMAPGAEVLSTVPYLTAQEEHVSVDGVGYAARALEGSGVATVHGPLVDCGLGDPSSIPADLPTAGWVALLDRGEINFADKVRNVMDRGAIGAIVANNDQENSDDPGSGFTLYAEPEDETYDWVTAVSVSYHSGQRIRSGEMAEATVTMGGEDYYNVSSGTSMASPHVAGIAALVWTVDPQLTHVEVREILQDTAEALGLAPEHQGHGLARGDLAVRSAFFSEGPPLAMTVYAMDFGTVGIMQRKTLVDIPIVAVEGPNVSEMTVEARAIAGGDNPWMWGDGSTPDTIRLDLTINQGPDGLVYPLSTLELAQAEFEYSFFSGQDVEEGVYVASVSLNVGPHFAAALDEQMIAILVYKVTAP